MLYDVNYFIKKFEAIPEEKWCRGYLTDPFDSEKHCALGHCGNICDKHSREPAALNSLFRKYELMVTLVNDLNYIKLFKSPTPKGRILAALYYIKSKEQQVEISDPPVTVEDIIGEQVVIENTFELCSFLATGSVT